MSNGKPSSILLLINARSRSGATAGDRARRAFERAGITVQSAQPDSVEECDALIRQHKKRIDAVVMGGGDGTMHSVAETLLDTGLPLGILPLGTANDLARTLKIPKYLDQAIDIIVSGATTQIFLGRVNNSLFFNIANIGLGVRVNQKLSGSRKRSYGALSYAKACVDVVRSPKPFVFELQVDGIELSGRSIQLAVGKGRFYGGGMKVNHASDPRKPTFFVYSVRPRSIRKLVKVAPRIATGHFKRHSKGVLSFEAEKLTLKTDPVRRVYADGEAVAFTPANFEVEPRQLTVFSPLDEIKPLRQR